VRAPAEAAERVLAAMSELAPEGFEQVDGDGYVEFALYGAPGELPELPEGEAEVAGVTVSVSGSEVPDDWEERWKRFHVPLLIGGELYVRPPWEEPPPDALAVVIDPGRAFGTGGHATTRLCLELLPLLPRGSLVDVGCGSGVLSIAAVLLGFEPVIALDSDPQAVEATRENAERNGVVLDVRHHDALDEPVPAAGSAVANITAEAVRELAPRVEVSHLLTSGYLVSEQVSVDGFRALDRRVRDGWAADLSRRETA